MVFAGHVPGSVTPAEASDAGQKSIEHLTGILQACSSKEDQIRKETEAASKSGERLPISAAIKYQLAAAYSFDCTKDGERFAPFVENRTSMAPQLTVLRGMGY